MKISLCASAIRTEHWLECYNSLLSNTIEWELVFVGPNRPNFELPKNLIYVYATTKPSQCYEISFRKARGELIGWIADDAIYPDGALDRMYNLYKSFDNDKIVAAFRTVEDGRDITGVHRFIGRNIDSPIMAPFGVVNREMFNKLGGYDRNFICGQSENDVVMRFLEIGGRVEITDIPVYVNHKKDHYQGTVFRSNFYLEDRKVLEGAWMKDGRIMTKRNYPVEPFSDVDITSVTQAGKGMW